MGLGDRMALTEGGSFVVSSIVSLLLFSGMQVYKTALASSQLMTILAGFTGSLLFVFLLTAVSNLEKSVFGFNFQTKLAEVVFCMLVSMSAAGTVHRVAATTCLLFSIAMTWSLNKMSQETYSVAPAVTTSHTKKKK